MKMVVRLDRLDIVTAAGHVSVYPDGVTLVTNCLLYLEPHQLDEFAEAIALAKQFIPMAQNPGWQERIRALLPD